MGRGWEGIKHLSVASLMAGHSSFIKPLASLSSLGCWGQQENRAHTPLSVHLSILSYVLIYHPTLFHHPSILCPLFHLHNLVCHAFVPLCLSFSAYSAIFCANLLFTFSFDEVEGKDDALSLQRHPNKCLHKRMDEGEKLREECMETSTESTGPQSGPWNRSYSS